MADLTKKNRTTPIENRNFLSPLGFKFALKRSPSVAFFCNQANIPEMTLGVADQPTPFKDIPINPCQASRNTPWAIHPLQSLKVYP